MEREKDCKENKQLARLKELVAFESSSEFIKRVKKEQKRFAWNKREIKRCGLVLIILSLSQGDGDNFRQAQEGTFDWYSIKEPFMIFTSKTVKHFDSGT